MGNPLSVLRYGVHTVAMVINRWEIPSQSSGTCTAIRTVALAINYGKSPLIKLMALLIEKLLREFHVLSVNVASTPFRVYNFIVRKIVWKLKLVMISFQNVCVHCPCNDI